MSTTDMTTTKVVVRGSGRHVHLSKADVETLFGPGEELNVKSYLGDGKSGQYLSDKKVTIVGPRGEATASVLGPCRKQSQVELSYTEARPLGLKPPIGDSGKLKGTGACTLRGPAGEIHLDEGVIIARRHIHMTPADIEALNIHDGDFVWVKVEGERELLFGQVLVRVSPESARSVMHVDFDELNAAGLSSEADCIVLPAIRLN